MKILKQLLIICAFALAGNLLYYLLSLAHVPFPGSLLGMILLFVFLLIGIVKSEHVEDVGKWFIDNMGIFFVPGAILILNNLQLLSAIWWKLIVLILATFVISFTATYWAVRLTLYLQARHQQKNEAEAPHD